MIYINLIIVALCAFVSGQMFFTSNDVPWRITLAWANLVLCVLNLVIVIGHIK